MPPEANLFSGCCGTACHRFQIIPWHMRYVAMFVAWNPVTVLFLIYAMIRVTYLILDDSLRNLVSWLIFIVLNITKP